MTVFIIIRTWSSGLLLGHCHRILELKKKSDQGKSKINSEFLNLNEMNLRGARFSTETGRMDQTRGPDSLIHVNTAGSEPNGFSKKNITLTFKKKNILCG